MTEPTKTTSENWLGQPFTSPQIQLHTETREADRRLASARAIVMPAGEEPEAWWLKAIQVHIEVRFPAGSMPTDKSVISERVLLHTEAPDEVSTGELRIIRAQLDNSVNAIMRAIESVHAEHMAAKTDG